MGLFLRVCLAAGVILVSFYAYNPVPPGIEEPIRYFAGSVQLHLIEQVSKVAEMFGIDDMRIIQRDLIHKLYGSLVPFGKNLDGLEITNTTFAGVHVIIYRTVSQEVGKSRGGLIYLHGGGFNVGNINLYHGAVSDIARHTDQVVAFISYRLAPEHPSPAAMEDCLAASRYFFAHAKTWGVDPLLIGVAGDSAGGNMASVLSLKFRDEGGAHQFAYQVLIYPWMQALNFRLPSYLEKSKYMPPYMKQYGMVLFTVTYIGVDRKHIPKFQTNQHVSKQTRLRYSKYFKMESLPGYKALDQEEDIVPDEDLAKEIEPLITNPDNFPLMAESLENLPPALVITVGVDPLRDEGLLYLQRLRAEEVEVEHYHDDICWHCAFNPGMGPKAFICGARLTNRIIQYINKQVEKTMK